MFGAVDLERLYPNSRKTSVKYKLHIDAAYGGFVYPFFSATN
jgi:glutamate/tyrosine decarboxylase-like PLP-dependent enzyme